MLAYLRNENLNRVNLEKIAFRMRDRGFCEDVLALLQKKHYYSYLIWSYSIHHHLKASIPTFLQHSEYADHCGLFIDSPLLTLDPVARRAYQHLEYKPLVNARAHLLGKKRKILNDRLYDQYHRLLTYLSYRPELKSEDLLAVCHQLLLQDRAPEAIAFFERIDPERLASRLQYDYIRAYFGFYTSAFDEMRAIAGRYTDYPVMRWRKRFQQIIAQLDEIEGLQPQTVDRRDRDEMQTHLWEAAFANPCLV